MSAADSGFTKTMDNARRSMGGLDQDSQKTSTSILDIAKGIGVFKLVDAGVNMVKESIGGAISRFDTLNNSTRSFENMGFTAGEVDTAMKALEESVSGLPTPLDSAISNVQLLASSTDDLSKSEQIFSAMNNGILGFGGTTAQVDNAVVQLSQSFSNGKVDAQTWNSMINSGLGPTLSALGKTMGKTTGELKAGLSDGTISVDDFQDALIDLNKNGGGGLKSLEKIAQDATGGIGTGIENMKTAVVRGVADVMTAIDDSLKDANFGSIGDVIGKIGGGFETALGMIADNIPNVISFVSDLYKKIEPFMPLIMVVTGYILTYQAVMGTAKKAIEIYTGAQKLMNAAMSANPVGLLVAAILILVGTVIYLWNTNEDFREAVIKIWDNIKKVFSDAAEGVINAWEKAKEFFSDLWSGIKETGTNIWTGIKDAAIQGWQETVDAITPYIEIIMNIFEPLVIWFSEYWDRIKTVAVSAWEIIKSVIMAPVLFLTDIITGDFEQLKADMSMIWTTISENASIIWSTLKDHVLGFISALVETAGNLWNTMKNFAIQKWTELKGSAQKIWTDLKDSTIRTFTALKDGAIQKWNDLKQGTIDSFNGIVSDAKEAWSTMLSNVTDFISKITGSFDKISEIDLWEAGKAIMDSFLKGLKEKWESVKGFVGGIGDWIRDNKGPISYDKKLLIPAGNAIMSGLDNGLTNGFEKVKKNISGMGSELSNSFDARLSLPALDGLDTAMSQSVSRTINADSELLVNHSKQPAKFNISIGKQKFRAFVDDISEAQGGEMDLILEF